MTLDELVKKKREDILKIAAKYGARNIRIIGSVARQETNAESDLDFLVDLDPDRTLLDHAGLQIELEELLGVDVDVATANGLKEEIKDDVMHEAVAL